MASADTAEQTADQKAKAKAEAEAKAKAEARAGKIVLLRDGLVLLEDIVNTVATTKEQHHPLNDNRQNFMAGMKPVLSVLGREGSSEKGVTPATDQEIIDALGVAAHHLGNTNSDAYKPWEGRIKRWLKDLKAS